MSKDKINKIKTLKRKQELAADVFSCMLGNGIISRDHQYESASVIKDVIKQELNIDISHAEACDFWILRSNDVDSSFLCIYKDDDRSRKDIVKSFVNFLYDKMSFDEEPDCISEYE